MADRIFVREDLAHERLADDHHERRVIAILRGEVTATAQRHADGLEVARARQAEVGVR